MSLPVFEVAPGMPVHLVMRASTVAFPPIDATRRHAYLQPSAPHAFSLRCDDDTAVAIGDSRFTVVQVHRGTAARIFTTATIDYVAQNRALDEAAQVIDRLEAAGFTATERVERAICEARAASDEQVRIAEHHAPFGSGSWRAEIWLRTVMRKGSVEAEFLGLRGDQCLVNVVIHDDAQRLSNNP